MTRPPLYDDEIAKFNLRLPKPLYEGLRQLARSEHLSLNQLMVRIFQAELDKQPRATDAASRRS